MEKTRQMGLSGGGRSERSPGKPLEWGEDCKGGSLSLRSHNSLVVFTKIERVKCPFPTTCVRWSFQ